MEDSVTDEQEMFPFQFYEPNQPRKKISFYKNIKTKCSLNYQRFRRSMMASTQQICPKSSKLTATCNCPLILPCFLAPPVFHDIHHNTRAHMSRLTFQHGPVFSALNADLQPSKGQNELVTYPSLLSA